MPKTIINEIDNTSSEVSSSLTNTVYIPIKIRQKIVQDGREYTYASLVSGVTDADLLPHLLIEASDLDELKEASTIKATYSATIGETSTSVEFVVMPDLAGSSYALAKYLLNNGFRVLLQIVTDDSAKAWSHRFDKLKDRGLYDPKFLILGEFTNSSAAGILSSMVGCAERRGDCVALVDHPEDLSSVELPSGVEDTYSARVHQWIASSSIASSYAAFFSPWCSNSIYNTGTKSSPVYPLLPPSYSFLIAYANSVKSNPSWLAAAGAFRGAVPGLVKVGAKFGEQDIDNIQCREVTYANGKESFGGDDNVGIAGNPICNIDPFGIIIWGNRTGINNTEGLKATSFLNIRLLACDIKKTMWRAARRYTFEQNTLRLWLNFCSQIRPLLDQAKTGEGISSYKFVQEETNVKARLKARVIIVPIEAVEDFELSFVLEDTIETEESAG